MSGQFLTWFFDGETMQKLFRFLDEASQYVATRDDVRLGIQVRGLTVAIMIIDAGGQVLSETTLGPGAEALAKIRERLN